MAKCAGNTTESTKRQRNNTRTRAHERSALNERAENAGR